MDDMIVVACDGIWDCVTNDECATKINKSLKTIKDQEGKDLSTPLALLFDEILAENAISNAGTDNMTAVIVKLTSEKK